MITTRALLLVAAICSAAVTNPALACESCAATNVFALARHSDVIARAAVVRETVDQCFLILLENFAGRAPRGARIELRGEDAALQHGTEVLVFACWEERRWIASAGPRSCLPSSEMDLGPILAWFKELPAAERTSFQASALAQDLALKSARWREDLRSEQTPLATPERFRPVRGTAPSERNFLSAIRTRTRFKH